MLGLNYREVANFIMDGAALFILTGMIIYTSLFRKRGRTTDKIFFAMILLDAVAALSDVAFWINYIFEDGNSNLLTVFCVTLFFLAIDVFMFLLSVYVIFRRQWDRTNLRKYLPFMGLPLICLIAHLILSIYLSFFYKGELSLAVLIFTSYNCLQYAPVIIYSVMILLAVFKKNKRVLALFIALAISHIFVALTSSATISPLIMTVYLIYAHLFAMRDSFYEETAKEC